MSRIREAGPGTPEAIAAFAEYEAIEKRKAADARRERIVAAHGQRIVALEDAISDQHSASAVGPK